MVVLTRQQQKRGGAELIEKTVAELNKNKSKSKGKSAAKKQATPAKKATKKSTQSKKSRKPTNKKKTTKKQQKALEEEEEELDEELLEALEEEEARRPTRKARKTTRSKKSITSSKKPKSKKNKSEKVSTIRVRPPSDRSVGAVVEPQGKISRQVVPPWRKYFDPQEPKGIYEQIIDLNRNSAGHVKKIWVVSDDAKNPTRKNYVVATSPSDAAHIIFSLWDVASGDSVFITDGSGNKRAIAYTRTKGAGYYLAHKGKPYVDVSVRASDHSNMSKNEDGEDEYYYGRSGWTLERQ